MPTVPTYQSNVRDIASPDVKIANVGNAEAFGAGQSNAALAEAGRGLSQEASKIFAEEKQKADKIAVLDASTKLSALETKLLYDPQSGALNKRGKDAFGIPEQVMGDFNKEATQIGDNLGNDDQRLAFKASVNERVASLDKQVQHHVATERKQYDLTVTDSYVGTERDAAAANYHDSERVDLSIYRQQNALKEYAQMNGLPAEWVKSKMEEVSSKTQSSVINRMLANGEDMRAKKYYDSVKDQISGPDLTHLDRALEEGTLRGESQRRSDVIMQKDMSLGDSLDEARQIKDPKLRDETTTRIRDRFSLKQAADREAAETYFKNAADYTEETKGRPDPDVWANLSLHERNSLDARIKQLNEGVAPSTNWDKWYDLMGMAGSADTKQKFMDMNLKTLRPEMADAEFKQLTEMQKGLRLGSEKPEKALDTFRTDQTIVNDTLNANGINHQPKPGTDDSKKVNQFRRMVDEQVAQIQDRTGKKATNAEVQGVVDNLIVKGVTSKGIFGISFFDTKKSLFQVSPEDKQFEIDIHDVPALERQKIEQSLRSHGRPINDKVILDLYGRKLNTMVPRGQ